MNLAKLTKQSVFTSLLLLSACATAQSPNKSSNCEITNAALDAMPPIEVTLTRADGSTYALTAKLANNNHTRAEGFQRVCESTMRETPILFTFESEVIPSFHMNNVVAPIDIAFIRKNNAIDVIHAMQPYSLVSLIKPVYAPNKPIVAALETHKGFYADNNIDLSSTVTWQQASSNSGSKK